MKVANSKQDGGKLAEAEAERLVLERRARELAARRIRQEQGELLEIVVFTLGEERYAVESGHVLEVVALTSLTQVPGAPPFIFGITSLRGDVLALLDLRQVLSTRSGGLTDLGRVLVLGSARAEVGVMADRVESVVQLDKSELADPPGSLSALARDFVRAVTRDGVLLLDGSRLMFDERLFVTAAGEVQAVKAGEV